MPAPLVSEEAEEVLDGRSDGRLVGATEPESSLQGVLMVA
jgi:hypothetical protein